MGKNRPSNDPPAAAPFTVAALRAEMGLSLEEFGVRIGLSKGNASILERGGPCSLRVALALETLSGGRLDAARLNADVAAARLVPTTDVAAPDHPQRIITCAVCDRRLDCAAAAQCELVDCPRAEREAA